MLSKFETEITVLPRDIDVNGHVHHSVYMDYLLAARFDQMARCYKMSMEEFQKMGFTWFARKYEIEYKFPVELGDCVIVRTWVEKAGKMSVEVGFEMQSKKTGRMAVKGLARFVLIDIHTNRPAKIPEDVIEKYSV